MPATLDKFYDHLSAKKQENKRKRIYEWIKDRSRIESVCTSSTKASMKVLRGAGTATTISAAGEEAITEWIKSLREEGVPVSRLMLELKAKTIAEDEKVPDGIFEASWTWQQGFLRRHKLSLRAKTRQGQKKPEAMEADAKAFWEEVAKTKIELGVDKIFNADQSGVCFEYLPKRTINKRGPKTVWVRCGGKDKERFTGMFMADSTGKQYDPFFVVRTKPSKKEVKAAYNTVKQNGFGDTLWKEIAPLSEAVGAQIYGNESAWWTSDLSIRFLDYHFANREECLPVLLLLDDFSAHWTDEVKEHAKNLSVHLMPVPPGLTSVCQPADISWFRPFKQRLRRQWVNELQQQLRAHHEQREQTPFQLVAPKRKDAITWAMSSWRSLGSSVIRSGFSGLHKVGSSAAVAVTETVEPENDLVEALELANVVEETIDDSDDIIDRLQADVE
ncbi:hypothetical protein AM588_10005274 [Phytophthora nicotianae]|uniref:HTH CENPB-type domain-containing protein n=1 Tax=Phytophthora nicotianae TaxID=4792 RepID=A0A0W8CYA7_PHYNI|nr:hypothetical protein AM588_10005274 [Phytophthora nicotianae]